ncbi:MAG: hypothetical protein ACO1OQ_15580 [Rufibacter sp.]
MRKGLKITLLVLLVILVAGAMVFTLTPTRTLVYLAPEIDHLRVTDAKIDEQTASMNILADVKPTLVSGFIDSVEYDFKLYGTSIGRGKKTFSHAEMEGKVQTLKIPLTMNHNVTRELVRRQVAQGGKVQAVMKAYTHLPLLGQQVVDINQDLDMIIPALPGAELTKLKITDFGLDEMEMVMTMVVDNPNHFDFYVREYKLDLQLKDYMTSVGEVQKEYLVKARSKTPIEISSTGDVKTPIKTAFKTLIGDKDVPYSMTTYMVLEPKSEVVGKVEMNATKTGTINLIEQVKKLKQGKKAEKKAEKEKEEKAEEQEKQAKKEQKEREKQKS